MDGDDYEITDNDDKRVYFDGERNWDKPMPGFRYKICNDGICNNIVVGSSNGKPPSKCLKHRAYRGSEESRKDFRPILTPDIIAETSEKVVKQSSKEIAIERGMRAREICDARKLAVAMRVEKNPERAARLAGILKEGAELDELIKVALGTDLDDLREGKQSATAGTITVAAALMAELMLESVFELPTSSIPNALSQLVKAIEPLGGFKKSYTNVNVIFQEAEQ